MTAQMFSSVVNHIRHDIKELCQQFISSFFLTILHILLCHPANTIKRWLKGHGKELEAFPIHQIPA